jgi:NAD-dependent SIR2 family protein deacetylase
MTSKQDNYFIFTSNVDGQFQKAGFDAQKIVERHGSIHFNQCVEPCSTEVWSNEGEQLEVNLDTFLATNTLPTCKHCGVLARPNILMFGDWGYQDTRQRKQEQRLHDWIRQTVEKKLKIAIVEIGAGKEIPTVRRFSEDIASQYGARLIRINPRDYDGPENIIPLPLAGLEALEKIFS